MHNMVFMSLRLHSDTWAPRGCNCDRLVVNLLLALHNKYQIDSIAWLAWLLDALLVFRPADLPTCLPACLPAYLQTVTDLHPLRADEARLARHPALMRGSRSARHPTIAIL